MAILVMLSIVLFVAYRTNMEKSVDSKRKTDVYNIAQVLEEYEKDNESYPANLTACGVSTVGSPLENYIGSVPCDPQRGTDYGYQVGPTAGNRAWFKVFALLKNTGDTDIARLGCSAGCGPGNAFNYFAASPNSP